MGSGQPRPVIGEKIKIAIFHARRFPDGLQGITDPLVYLIRSEVDEACRDVHDDFCQCGLIRQLFPPAFYTEMQFSGSISMGFEPSADSGENPKFLSRYAFVQVVWFRHH